MITNGGMVDVFDFEYLCKIAGFYSLCTALGFYCIDFIFAYLKKKSDLEQ